MGLSLNPASLVMPEPYKGESPTTSTCPICSAYVPPSSLISHVNNCLDAQCPPELPVPLPEDIPSPPPSPPPAESSPPPPTPKPPSSSSLPLSAWLSSLGLPKYATGFLRAGYRNLSDLVSHPTLSDNLLRSKCGVTALGARKKIIAALAILQRDPPKKSLPALSSKESTQPSSHPQEQPQPKKRLWAIFEPGYRAIDPPSKRPRSTSSAVWTPSTSSVANSSGAQAPPRPPRSHTFSHRVPGTQLTVDSFYAARGDPPGSLYFLSHFHSDHYGPLRKTALPKDATVMCSSVTASLIKSILRVPKEAVQVLPIGVKVDLKERGVSVWAYDANHCPGACVFLFRVWNTGRWVLHTGDCRFERDIFERHGKIAEVINGEGLDFLFLDTTYCDPRYVFPRQKQVLECVVEAAREENRRTKGRCLFFFGTYSIGKERVFLAVAEALDLHIYAGKRKKGILEQCGFGKRLSDRLVSSAGQARVQIVSMRALSAEGLRKYAEMNKLNTSFIGRGLAIVFRPTGWTFKGNGAAPRRSNRTSDQAMFYEVPYSEHSSYEELKEFVIWSKPRRLVPTVNARSAEQGNRLRELLGHVDKPLRPLNSGVVRAER